MIAHLHIKNFMCFKDLEIPTLKRVNLIAGKNNAGKTTLLDAVRILKSDADNAVINHILHSRRVLKRGLHETYENLFNYNLESSLTRINDVCIECDWDEDGANFFLRDHEKQEKKGLNSNLFIDSPHEDLVYVRFNSDFNTLNQLWENIVLTPQEDDIYKIVRDTIQPDLIRLDVGREIVRVRLQDTEKPVSLGTLGDGVYRILLIALSLANAQNSILLIDELELGLHYSALEKLWNMIFKYAKKWDIQVFATTHSQDVLRTFHYVADDAQYINDAQYIRLQVNRKGENEAIIFDGERMRESLELELEIR